MMGDLLYVLVHQFYSLPKLVTTQTIKKKKLKQKSNTFKRTCAKQTTNEEK